MDKFQVSTPLTPNSEANPEKLTFNRKLEKFEHEINEQQNVEKSQLVARNLIYIFIFYVMLMVRRLSFLIT